VIYFTTSLSILADFEIDVLTLADGLVEVADNKEKEGESHVELTP
jgi:hypothetical protein